MPRFIQATAADTNQNIVRNRTRSVRLTRLDNLKNAAAALYNRACLSAALALNAANPMPAVNRLGDDFFRFTINQLSVRLETSLYIATPDR
jgi:hypothetical protein